MEPTFRGERDVNRIVLGIFLVGSLANAADPYRDEIALLLKSHCTKCHGPTKQAGDVRLDDLKLEAGKDVERWMAVRDQVRDRLMPPPKEPKLDSAKARALVAFAAAQTGGQAAKLPNQGNLVPHELLFGTPATGEAAAPSRVWRLSPEGYLGLAREIGRGNLPGLVQPFTKIQERGIKDFAGLYTIDEPSTEVLLRNAEAIVDKQTAHEIKDGVPRGKNDSVGEFVKLMDPKARPTRPQIESAIALQFRIAIGQAPEAAELERYLGLYDKCVSADDAPDALRTVLKAVLLKTDAMFRHETGGGKADGNRQMIAPNDLARALSLSLGDRRDGGLFQAASKGELATRDQVAAQLRRMIDDPKAEKTRLLRFFHEYFEYDRAGDVFKEKPTDRIKHVPWILVRDTDELVKSILAADKDVFRELLTTSNSFVNYSTKQNKMTRKDEPVPADVIPKGNGKDKPEWLGGVDQVYGFDQWPTPQPAPLPKDTRIGILMQPSWLVAFSTNFDNDPVRRGRWIRERLLGGTVPDLPIGVVAQVPDDPHRGFRDRLTVTRDASCWKCHQRMDDLGLPFEQFDHYGRYRKTETVRDVEATEKNVDKKGKPLGPIDTQIPLSTAGKIADSGVPALDGDYADPRQMITKIANSDRARQVFIRHAFRFFLGRNETLGDALTLQAADKAYVESGGSFKALVVALLSSDSFLYRTPAAVAVNGVKP